MDLPQRGRSKSDVDSFEEILFALERVLEVACTALLVALIASIFSGVVSRYVFNASLSWTDELGQFLFIWIIFIGIAIGHQRRAHVTIGLLDTLLRPAWLDRLNFIADVLVAYTTILLIANGWKISWFIGGYSPALQWPAWAKYTIVPISSVIGLVFLATRGPDRRRSFLSVATGAGLYLLTDTFEIIRFEHTSPTVVMSIAFVVTLLLNVPIGFGLLFSAYVATLGFELLPPPAVVQTMVNGAGQSLLLAIPLFLAAGALMNSGTLTTRLIDFAQSLVGHFRGGLGHVAVLQSTMYGGISGSSGSDAAMHAKILVPEMVRRGYPLAFSCALSSASSILPNVIPPSIAMLLYCAITEVSIGRLFVAGILPGLLLAGCLMGTVYWMSWRHGYGHPTERAGLPSRIRAFVRAIPVLFTAVFILGGIRFGIVTPTEAGVVAAIWAFLLGKLVYRSYGWSELYEHLAGSAMDAALIGFLIAVASPFAWVLIAERIPETLVTSVIGHVTSPIAILLIMNLIMLIAGTALELPAAMLILVPLFFPIIQQAGIDPVHFGVIVVANLMFGGLTPPVGILVFITSSIAKIPANTVFREVTPFLIALIAGLVMITYVPALSLWLVRLVY